MHRRWHVFARVYRRSIVPGSTERFHQLPDSCRFASLEPSSTTARLVFSSRGTAFTITERQHGSSRESRNLSLSLSRFEKAAAEIAIGSINAARGCNRASSRRVSRLMIVGGFQPPSSFLSALLLSEEDNKRAVRLCVCVASVEIVIERSNAGISFFARIDRGSIQQTFKTSV